MPVLRQTIKKLLSFLPDTLVSQLGFEIHSLWGRLSSPPLKLGVEHPRYLNLGSGPKLLDGFINLDFFGTPGIDFGADLRHPLKIASSALDGIFCEHTLEHLSYRDADRLLSECHRLLRPGKRLRIVVPDLQLFLENYAAGNDAWFAAWERCYFLESEDPARARRRLATNLQAVSFVTQEYGHISCWDYQTLKYYLEKNGFCHIVKTGFREGGDPLLLADMDHRERRMVSVYVEAQKPDDEVR